MKNYVLHIVFSMLAYERLVALLDHDDEIDSAQKVLILLIDDAVYLALPNLFKKDLAVTPRHFETYALIDDLQIRGVQARIAEEVKTVDYAGFVELVVATEKLMIWK